MDKRRSEGAFVIPHNEADIYKALKLTSFNEVKVVVLNRFPESDRHMADGLAISNLPHVRKKSNLLRSLILEYKNDLGYPGPHNGSLVHWANEGVLLLNTLLTCEEGNPKAHEGVGWEKLIIEIISRLSYFKTGIVFILVGSKANEYRARIDENKHLIISLEPNENIATTRFPLLRNSRLFSRANTFLVANGIHPVNWKLPGS